ncbi:hypothetical protein K7X08_037787 [Anisodus acutangulus]|uniref:Uncharacterized protein n=1 Tax=Anisodus acutangulus TaxID=402998 RepID=A0A9Q1N0R0_9SOLA|nr:hypothetical protein K7X08_037787 [Anisodus acutangulus]
MATRKSFLFVGAKDQRISPISPNDLQFEFEEADKWNTINSTDHDITNIVPNHSESKRSTIPSSRFLKNPTKKSAPIGAATSLPVNVPDWSKILGNEYKNCNMDNVGDNKEFDEDNIIPPHEYLTRTRVASFSVQEELSDSCNWDFSQDDQFVVF